MFVSSNVLITCNFAIIKSEVKSNPKYLETFFWGDLQEREKQIVMQWRQKSWPDEHYSTVTLALDQTEDGTELTLTQTGVPEAEYEKTVEGWKRYYWDAIKQTFGFGASLF